MPDGISTTRRTVVRTLGSVAAATVATSAAAGARPDEANAAADAADDCGAEQYVAVVDRIVDGEHVVLLLEDQGELVDQLVVGVDEFDEVAERDIMTVVLKDDELLAYTHRESRPGS